MAITRVLYIVFPGRAATLFGTRKGPFKNYVIPLLKLGFGVFVCAGGAFAAMIRQTA